MLGFITVKENIFKTFVFSTTKIIILFYRFYGYESREDKGNHYCRQNKKYHKYVKCVFRKYISKCRYLIVYFLYNMQVAFTRSCHISKIYFFFLFSDLVCIVATGFSTGASDETCLFSNCKSSKQVRFPLLNVTLLTCSFSEIKNDLSIIIMIRKVL